MIGGFDMRWTINKTKDRFKWYTWFAWYPVLIKDTWAWLELIERRSESSINIFPDEYIIHRFKRTRRG